MYASQQPSHGPITQDGGKRAGSAGDLRRPNLEHQDIAWLDASFADRLPDVQELPQRTKKGSPASVLGCCLSLFTIASYGYQKL